MAIIRAPKSIVILLTVAAFALVTSTLAAVTVNQNFPSTGTIASSPNIGVYADSACTAAITSVSWGSTAPGGTTTQTVYVKNTGTVSMTLSMIASNWNPLVAGTYMTITWNKEGSTLAVGQSTAAILTLTVSPTVTGITNFGNTITISGTG